MVATPTSIVYPDSDGLPMKLRQAPGVMVVFGRPKGDRSNYQQWKENNLLPQVAFEIISPSNPIPEMTRKFQFYDRYGIEEYYIYDPDRLSLGGFVRQDGRLEAIDAIGGWVSPRLEVRFTLGEDGSLELYRPDGQPFERCEEIAA
jgi:Uma2 family endonuclease